MVYTSGTGLGNNVHKPLYIWLTSNICAFGFVQFLALKVFPVPVTDRNRTTYNYSVDVLYLVNCPHVFLLLLYSYFTWVVLKNKYFDYTYGNARNNV